MHFQVKMAKKLSSPLRTFNNKMQLRKSIKKTKKYILSSGKYSGTLARIDVATQWEDNLSCEKDAENVVFSIGCQYELATSLCSATQVLVNEECAACKNSSGCSNKRGRCTPSIDIPLYEESESENLPHPILRYSDHRYICLPLLLAAPPTSPVCTSAAQLTPLVNMSNLLNKQPHVEVFAINTPKSSSPIVHKRLRCDASTVMVLRNETGPIQSPSPDTLSIPTFARSSFNAIHALSAADASFESSPQSTAATDLSPKRLTCWPAALLGPVVGVMPFQTAQGVLARPRAPLVSARASKADQQWMNRQAKARQMKTANLVGYAVTNKPRVPHPIRSTRATRITMNEISWQRAKNPFEIEN